jgi:hypothetical protein
MNYLQRTIDALAKSGDTEMVQLFRRFNERLNRVLTPTEIDTYARYLLAPVARVRGAPATFAEQAVRDKVRADPAARALGKQIVERLGTRNSSLQSRFGQN